MPDSVIVLAPDWRAPCWQTGFYPEDMPEEWRLAYLSTQFDGVWLARDAWRDAIPDRFTEWLSDTRPEFVFLLEGNGPDDAMADPSLSGRVRFLPFEHPDVIWFDCSVDLRQLSARLQADAAGTILLPSRDGDSGTIARVMTLVDVLGLGRGDRVG